MPTPTIQSASRLLRNSIAMPHPTIACFIRLLPLISLLSLNACTRTHLKSPPLQAPLVAPAATPQPRAPFEAGTLYSLLTAEIAGQRQRHDILLSNYLQQAERTKDPGIVAQAALIARQLNQRPQALRISQLWVEVAPQSPQAHQSLMIELALDNRPLEALREGEFLLQHNTENGLDKLAAQVIQQEQEQAKSAEAPQNPLSAALLPRYQQLLQQHPQQESLLLGASYLLLHQGQPAPALTFAQRAAEQQPQNPYVLHQQARIYQALNQPNEALAKMGQVVNLQPHNHSLRLEYAKQLAKHNLPAAEEHFQHLAKQNPQNAELSLTLALILLEQKKWAQAEPLLAGLLNHPRYGNSAHLYAGQVAQQLQNPKVALQYFNHIPPGAEYLSAQQSASQLLLSLGEGARALAEIRQKAPLAPPQQAQGFILLEAKLLLQLNSPDQAEALLSQQILQHTNPAALLYARSLLYSDSQQHDKANKDLRAILVFEPNNSMALNALGYNLSQSPQHLDEALQYVQKAHEISPNEPAIMDSLGWVYFKKGELKPALLWLHRAYTLWPDPEVAAHYGEALWADKRKAQARHIWQKAWQKHPKHPVLQDTLKRFSIQLD